MERENLIVISGLWGIGKSTFLKSLSRIPSSISVNLSLFWITQKQNLKTAGQNECLAAIEHIKPLAADFQNMLNCTEDPTLLSFASLLKNNGINLYLFLDEATRLALNQSAFSSFCELIESIEAKKAVVLHHTNSSQVESNTAYLKSKYSVIFPSALDLEALTNYLADVTRIFNLNFCAGAAKKILELTGGRPYEINVLIRSLLNNQHDKNITEHDLWNIEPRNNPHNDISRFLNTVYNSNFSEGLTTSQERALKCIEEGLSHENITSSDLAMLEKLTYLRMNDSGHCLINGSYLRHFVASRPRFYQ